MNYFKLIRLTKPGCKSYDRSSGISITCLYLVDMGKRWLCFKATVYFKLPFINNRFTMLSFQFRCRRPISFNLYPLPVVIFAAVIVLLGVAVKNKNVFT